ncbi:hypothetical protein ACOME3_009623 [Neoechinorhynchus agilis]
MHVLALAEPLPTLAPSCLKRSACACWRRDIEQCITNSKSCDDERLLNAQMICQTHPILSSGIMCDVLYSHGLLKQYPQVKVSPLTQFNGAVAALDFTKARILALSMYSDLARVCRCYLDLVRRENFFVSLNAVLESPIVQSTMSLITISLDDVPYDTFCYLNKLPMPGLVRVKQMLKCGEFESAMECLHTECLQQLEFWSTCKGAYLYLKAFTMLGIASKRLENDESDPGEFKTELERITQLLEQSQVYLTEVDDIKYLLASIYLNARVYDRLGQMEKRNACSKAFYNTTLAISTDERIAFFEEDFLIL